MPDQCPSSCWISFGGNTGDVKATFDAALALLSLHHRIVLGRRSCIYGTAPMGSQAGCRFLNSICELSTDLSPSELLTILQSVETQLGRVRTICWGPRTLDLDLLTYGDRIQNDSHLIIPHPAITYRRFVLDPLVEIDSKWCHPACGTSSRQLLDRLLVRPLRIDLIDIEDDQCQELALKLESKFPCVRIEQKIGTESKAIPIILSTPEKIMRRSMVDLRRCPGDALEKLTSALTAILDSPIKVSDW